MFICLQSTHEVRANLLNKFKNASGVHLLKPIFFEMSRTDERNFCVYTLKEEDHTFDSVTYPSLKRLYMEMNDPTEYNFATTYLDGWTHWKKLQQCEWFMEHLAGWREELEIRIKSRAVADIMNMSMNTQNEGMRYAGNKFLIDGGWKEKTAGAGRPTKDKIKREAERIFQNKSIVDDDLERILNG